MWQLSYLVFQISKSLSQIGIGHFRYITESLHNTPRCELWNTWADQWKDTVALWEMKDPVIGSWTHTSDWGYLSLYCFDDDHLYLILQSITEHFNSWQIYPTAHVILVPVGVLCSLFHPEKICWEWNSKLFCTCQCQSRSFAFLRYKVITY